VRGRVRKRLHTYRVGEFPPGLEVHVGKADDFTLLSVKQQPAVFIIGCTGFSNRAANLFNQSDDMLLDTKIPFSYLFNKVKYDLLVVLVISGVFHTIKIFFVEHLPVIPISLVTVLGTSIALLLAFKLNQSYDRWWEARKIWGSIVNDSRMLVLQLLGFIAAEELKEQNIDSLVRQMAYRQIGWCYSLGQSLRQQDPMANLDGLVAAHELSALKAQSNKPLYLLMRHRIDLRTLHQLDVLNDFQQIQVEGTIGRLGDSMGKAERIANTVFPVTYRKFLHFFIYIFLISLSIALVESIGVYEIPLLMIIASTFFLIEKSARHLQDPFSNRPTDIAITTIARTIEINIRQLLLEKNIPKAIAPSGFYVM
jgi:putative membrane protein